MGSSKYPNNAEPLRELETVIIELIEAFFFAEPMRAAKFPYPLPTHCIPGSVLINIVSI